MKSNHPYALSLQDYCEEKGISSSKITGLKDVNAGIEGKYRDQYIAIMRPDIALEKVGKFPKKIGDVVNQADKDGHGASILVKGEKAIAPLLSSMMMQEMAQIHLSKSSTIGKSM